MRPQLLETVRFSALALALLWSAVARAELPAVTSHKTPNGIAFRHVQIDGVARHTIAFGWHDAFARTLPGKEGLAYLGPRLMHEGTAALARSAYSERLKDLQARATLAGSPYRTIASLSAPPEKIGEAVTLFADVLANPALAADRLALLQKTMAASARQQAEQPEPLAHRLLHRLTLGPGPALDATVIDPESYARVTLDDVVAWRKAVLVQDRVIVASAGPMTADAVGREIDRLFAGLPKSGVAFAAPAVPSLKALGRTVLLERPVVQTIIVAEGPSGWTDAPDANRATLARRSMLGFDGRLMQAVRERLGAAYGVAARRFAYHAQAQSFEISSPVDNSKAIDALATLRSEYDRIIAEGLAEPAVANLKAKLLADLQETFRQPEQAALTVRSALLAAFPEDYYATLEARIGGYTAADITDGLKTKFPKAPLTVVIIAPSAEGFKADCVIKSPADIGSCE